MIINQSNESQRVLFARLSSVAYKDLQEARPAAKRLGFTKTVFIDVDGAQVYIFSNKHDVAISCRGTEPSDMNDVYADLQIFKADSVTGNKIHQGFKEEVDKIYDDSEVWDSNTTTQDMMLILYSLMVHQELEDLSLVNGVMLI